MSFHKLKIGQRKQKSHSRSQNSGEKVKELDLFGLNMNEKMQLNNDYKVQSVNVDHKLITTRKPNNIMSISDDFAQDMLKFKRPQLNIPPKTDRVHKIQRLQFGLSNNQGISNNNKVKREINQSNIVGEYSTASQVINFLSVQNRDNKGNEVPDKLQSLKGKQLKKDNKAEEMTIKENVKNNQFTGLRMSNNPNTSDNNQKESKKKVDNIQNKVDKKEILLFQSRQQEKQRQQEQQQQQQCQIMTVQNQQQQQQQQQEVFEDIQNNEELKEEKAQNNIQTNHQHNNSPQTTTKHHHTSAQLISRQSLPISTQQLPHIQSPTRSVISYKPINEIQLTILHQNKTLQQQVQKLRKQRDQLQFKSKRQQIQLLQSNNTQYYTKQISRLKQQVQSLQGINQQVKHQNFVVQNKNKQLQSTLQIKIKQTKKLIQDLQKVKIDSTKEKFQLKDKSNQLGMIVKQMEERNGQMSEKFQLYYSKVQEVQAKNKLLLEEITSTKSIIKQLETKLNNQQRMNKDKHRMLQNEVSQLLAQRQQLQNQWRQTQRQHQSQTETLKQSLKQLTLKRQSQALLISTRAKSLQKHNNNILTQMQVVKLQQQRRQLQGEVIKRSQLIKQLNKKIDGMISMKDYEELRVECERINRERVKEKQQYERKIAQLQNKLVVSVNSASQKQQKQKQLQIEAQQQHQITNSTAAQSTFKQLLKQQILQQDQLKHQLFNKQQSLHQLKQQLQDQIIKYQGLKNDHEILKKQFSSFENNSKMKKEIVQQELSNQIQTVKRKNNLLQKKLQSKIKQNQQKEQFIQTYIVGNNKSTDSQYLIKEIERIFLEKEKKQLQ